MKKILYFIDYPLDSLGGAQLSTQSICSELIRLEEGYEPVVVCPKLMSQTTFPYRVIEVEIDNSGLGLLKLVMQYRRIIKKEKPQVLHAQMPMAAMLIGILRHVGCIRKTKFVFTDRAIFDGYSRKSQWLFKKISKQIDMIICTTNINKSLWKRIIEESKIKVIYNSISPDFKNNIDIVRHKTDEMFTIGFAGRVTDFKDWPLSIEICKTLKNKLKSFRVGCVMSAYSHEEKVLMHNYIKEFREIMGEDFFYSIDLPQSEMPHFYSQLDAFVLTSKFESFGKTAIEAMCCGCAVLATNVGGLPEVIGVKQNLYDAQDIEKCVNLLLEYATDEELLHKEQQMFKQKFNNKFDTDVNFEKHIIVYDEVISNYDYK